MALSLDDLANAAAQASGLPAVFCKALIAEEGTYAMGSNNPFDVTVTWANLTGYGGHVTGTWNSVGVAIFDGEIPAIQSWAAGLATFSAYAQFRADKAAGAGADQLALDLQNAGYAGDDASYASKIVALVSQFGGTDAGGTAPGQVPVWAWILMAAIVASLL